MSAEVCAALLGLPSAATWARALAPHRCRAAARAARRCCRIVAAVCRLAAAARCVAAAAARRRAARRRAAASAAPATDITPSAAGRPKERRDVHVLHRGRGAAAPLLARRRILRRQPRGSSGEVRGVACMVTETRPRTGRILSKVGHHDPICRVQRTCSDGAMAGGGRGVHVRVAARCDARGRRSRSQSWAPRRRPASGPLWHCQWWHWHRRPAAAKATHAPAALHLEPPPAAAALSGLQSVAPAHRSERAQRRGATGAVAAPWQAAGEASACARGAAAGAVTRARAAR